MIAYIFQSGDMGYISGQTHGIIAATSDQSLGAQWGCSSTLIVTNTSLGTGPNNTLAIVNSCSETNVAASICKNLNSGNYSDWFLPSVEELKKVYLNRATLNGLSAYYYWCSSQYDASNALLVDFSSGIVYYGSKTSPVNVRAVRNF